MWPGRWAQFKLWFAFQFSLQTTCCTTSVVVRVGGALKSGLRFGRYRRREGAHRSRGKFRRSVDEKGRVVNPGERCGLCGEVGRCGKPEISEDEERWRVESGMDKCVIVGKRRYKMCGRSKSVVYSRVTSKDRRNVADCYRRRLQWTLPTESTIPLSQLPLSPSQLNTLPFEHNSPPPSTSPWFLSSSQPLPILLLHPTPSLHLPPSLFHRAQQVPMCTSFAFGHCHVARWVIMHTKPCRPCVLSLTEHTYECLREVSYSLSIPSPLCKLSPLPAISLSFRDNEAFFEFVATDLFFVGNILLGPGALPLEGFDST